MEPLVIFGAGLVMYCGYLAIMDEMQVLLFLRRYIKNLLFRKIKGLKGFKATRKNRRLSNTLQNRRRPLNTDSIAVLAVTAMNFKRHY